MIPVEVIKERLEQYEKELPLGRLAEVPMGIGTALELIRLLETAEHQNQELVCDRNRLVDENNALCAELLTPGVFLRLVDWLREDPIRPASGAFTASIERQIAYALEMDVVPMLKQARLCARNGRHDEFAVAELLMRPIASLGFSKKMVNTLQAEDLNTVGDLIGMTQEKLLRIPNFGRKALHLVTEAIGAFGLRLAG